LRQSTGSQKALSLRQSENIMPLSNPARFLSRVAVKIDVRFGFSQALPPNRSPYHHEIAVFTMALAA